MFLQEDSLIGLEVGTKDWFDAQKNLILSKPLLRFCYDAWYRCLVRDSNSVPDSARSGLYLELGSGGSLLKNYQAGIITSDVVEGVAEQVIDAMRIPFPNDSLSAIFMTHSFHHIPNVELFLKEAQRTLKVGGVLSMIEVSHTPFAKFFFSNFHHEPFDDRTRSWSFKQQDSMNDSNQALSWLIFFRDRKRFNSMFPTLCLERWSYLPWFSYLMSGGVTRKQILPSKLGFIARAIDYVSTPFWPIFALHWSLTIRKTAMVAESGQQ